MSSNHPCCEDNCQYDINTWELKDRDFPHPFLPKTTTTKVIHWNERRKAESVGTKGKERIRSGERGLLEIETKRDHQVSGPFRTSLARFWAGKVSCRHAVPGGHWVALVVKACTSLGSTPPTPPHILCKFQLPKDEIICSLHVSGRACCWRSLVPWNCFYEVGSVEIWEAIVSHHWP